VDSRGLSTVVEKLLSLSIVVLYTTLLTTVLYGGSVPAYQSEVGAELGERTLAEATTHVEQTVPETGQAVTATRRVTLPSTIDGMTYQIRTDNGTLVLDHPNDDIGGRMQPVMPSRVTAITGQWQSGGKLIISVTGDSESVTVRLEGRE
jgi:hypothetical protein